MAAMFKSDWKEMGKVYKGPSTDVPYQILIQLAKLVLEEKILNVSANQKKNRPWRPRFSSDRDKMGKLYN